MPGHHSGEGEDHDVLPGQIDPEARRAGLASPDGSEVPADGPPHRTRFTTDDAGQQDHHGQHEERVAVGVETPRPTQDGRTLIDCPWALDSDCGKTLLSKNSAAAMVSRAQPEAA